MTYDYFAYLNERKDINDIYIGNNVIWETSISDRLTEYIEFSRYLTTLYFKLQCAVKDLPKNSCDMKKKLDKISRNVQKYYRQHSKNLLSKSITDAKKEFPGIFNSQNSQLPQAHWKYFKIDFKLLTPWFSKDDRVFSLIHNPLRKDIVFNVPYMPASSWKGLLRYGCNLVAGLYSKITTNTDDSGKIADWKEPPEIIHLFGNNRDEYENFNCGTLIFYPTFFNKIDFAVINPHSRKTKAGKGPVYYEVVPEGTEASLTFIYAPIYPPKKGEHNENALGLLFSAVKLILTEYGFSAKKSAGWGLAEIIAVSSANVSVDELAVYKKNVGL